MITRHFYLQQIEKAKDTDFVKIITGIRRCGKSTLLLLFKESLLKQQVPADHIIEINYEKFTFDALRNERALHQYLQEKIHTDGKKYYLLLDEVQELPQWAKVINSIRVSFPVDIYVTGSNSRIFSGEYLTYITGRYIEIKVYPLSFSEFLAFRSYSPAETAFAFNEYLRIGSFPATALAASSELIESINVGLFDSIFSRDILLRGKIRDEGNFYKVAKFVLDNIGSPVSVSSIANALRSQGHRISADAVDNYLTLMCNAFLLYQCERYDIRGKERLRTNGKYYVADMGLRNQLIGYRTSNTVHIIENIVFLELKKRGFTINTGKYLDQEIDFIATKSDQKYYIQVAMTALDETTHAREFSPFYAIQDNYPKLLITMDTFDLSQEGFRHLNLFDFLLKNDAL